MDNSKSSNTMTTNINSQILPPLNVQQTNIPLPQQPSGAYLQQQQQPSLTSQIHSSFNAFIPPTSLPPPNQSPSTTQTNTNNNTNIYNHENQSNIYLPTTSGTTTTTTTSTTPNTTAAATNNPNQFFGTGSTTPTLQSLNAMAVSGGVPGLVQQPIVGVSSGGGGGGDDKRPRGRPRKNPPAVPKSPSIPKRKRGRPLKVDKDGNPLPKITLASPGKKRGRPKKNQDDDDDDTNNTNNNNNNNNNFNGIPSQDDKRVRAPQQSQIPYIKPQLPSITQQIDQQHQILQQQQQLQQLLQQQQQLQPPSITTITSPTPSSSSTASSTTTTTTTAASNPKSTSASSEHIDPLSINLSVFGDKNNM
ncbi:HMG-I and HMG-Y [Tieghemostelium lacteum]|uniref:HMG-I and HMG-Y n=1 Tax=Tieghemostelium lacteum TaxID=361077 RepID=A0A151ZII3_TIELA|nr:HMG-I and HMG-Y [Tieghemostelium lacteum]|eukprot:KYQ93811.1 HMG-I and HMG-Y [Tieghemostelium lacteum]